MFSRKVNVALLIFAITLDALILYFFSTPWVRLVLGLGLLLPIILLSAFLGLAEMLSAMDAVPLRPRRFLALRANVDRLLGEIKRLNWLVYDRDHGYRTQEAVLEDIEACRAGVEDALRRVLEVAGKPDLEVEEALGVESRGEAPEGGGPPDAVDAADSPGVAEATDGPEATDGREAAVGEDPDAAEEPEATARSGS